jgi:hypothetical protein
MRSASEQYIRYIDVDQITFFSPNGAGVRLVFTAQKLQPRVQVSPIIMMVAVAVPSLPPPQHSPMFGQRASSHTVANFSFRTFFCKKATRP